MCVQYKVNVSENQVDTLKETIRLKKGVTLCFPKSGGIRGDQGTSGQIRLSVRQVAKNVSYTGGLIMSLARALPFVARALTLQSCRDLQLVYFLVVLTKRLVAVVLLLEMTISTQI